MSNVSQTAEDMTLEDRIAELRIRLNRLEDAASVMGAGDEYCSMEDYWSLLRTLCFYDVPIQQGNKGSEGVDRVKEAWTANSDGVRADDDVPGILKTRRVGP